MIDPVALTAELVRSDTVNPPGNEEGLAQRIGALLEAAGLRCRYHPLGPGRASLVARLEGSTDAPPLCFTGHLDVVPLGAAPWSREPFGGETDGDLLYGRGSTDMKGGVAAMVAAVLQIAATGRPRVGLELVLTAGEEVGCAGAKALAATPGALSRYGAILVGEPTGNRPLLGHRGLVWLEVEARGVTAHASMPHEGVNAICKAARMIAALEHLDFGVAAHPLLGSPTLNIGTFSGGLNLNSVPDRASFGVDIRVLPGQSPEDILALVRSRVGDEAGVRMLAQAGGVACDPHHPWVRDVFAVVASITGERSQAAGAPYVTDASVLTPASGDPPTLILGPGETELAHKTDEYCRISRIRQAGAAYAEIAARWCAGDAFVMRR